MNSYKKYLISISITFAFILLFSFLINILNYFDIINKGVYKTLLILSSAISISFGSFFIGKSSNNKGYLKGALTGIISIVIFILFSTIFKHSISQLSFIYYLVLVITSTIAGMIGINKKITEKNSQ